jgi:hypothetical protein
MSVKLSCCIQVRLILTSWRTLIVIAVSEATFRGSQFAAWPKKLRLSLSPKAGWTRNSTPFSAAFSFTPAQARDRRWESAQVACPVICIVVAEHVAVEGSVDIRMYEALRRPGSGGPCSGGTAPDFESEAQFHVQPIIVPQRGLHSFRSPDSAAGPEVDVARADILRLAGQNAHRVASILLLPPNRFGELREIEIRLMIQERAVQSSGGQSAATEFQITSVSIRQRGWGSVATSLVR